MFTMCYYNREQKKTKKRQKWSETLIAVLDEVLKIET